ncbi:P-loop containing nucleoside triphosphate hydrolase protein [Catenaria anguillulae PL171]|uniref:p-loop containing nucleoside triphosphate hydrolase protein n=1 Tax=Catenaria anguillulae PL171 TaxID=765915 RepID=A0A1Y2I4C7_9FUNG|nr:P-loop containing nucleoside triphosphate hydrolase protein [Catenaria anguillulae PL171]
MFDHVYAGSDNEALYVQSMQQLVYSTMEGFNGTAFAYGQTASGKTFTMMGNDAQPGVIPRAVNDVFTYIKLTEGRREFLLRVSYLEIYNETIRDLLSPETRDLRIHEDRKRGVYVSPLKEEIVTSPAQVLKVITRGESNRHISTTDYNEHSSRSHTIFQMVIESRDPYNAASTQGSAKTVKISCLNLVDLAGSEKAATNADRRKEGAFINKSLLTLGSVIAKLTEEKASHIPYRDSKLTRILQSSLSGNARVSVVCTISPASSNVEESTNTLKFAARVKQVVTKAHTNHVMDDKALIQKYRKEISELKEKLMQTNQAFERERQLELMQIKAEKEKYEEELHEQHLLVCFCFAHARVLCHPGVSDLAVQRSVFSAHSARHSRSGLST